MHPFLWELVTFVADPAAPPTTNNAAERALPPLGGGSRTRMIFPSEIATGERRGLDPLGELLVRLRSPRATNLELPPV